MHPAEFYFVFHHPARISDIRAGHASVFSMMGHVEAMGYTIDGTWFFFDPGRLETSLRITHLHDEVEAIMTEKFSVAKEIIKISEGDLFHRPVHAPMNCVTQCAALVGIRAFTPAGFRKKLLRANGKVIHGTERRQGRETRCQATAQDGEV